MRTILKIIALALSIGFITPLQTSAQVSGELHIRVAPPAPIHEERGERPDRASIWIGGYHEYDPATSSYHWHPGRWDHRPHAGAVWVAPRYKRIHGEYKFYKGRWK